MSEKKKIWLSPPHLCGKEKELVDDAFATNWIAPLGPHVDAFEKELSTFTGAAACAALSSGTAALHLALILSGVGEGDTVICPSFTFSATANPVLYQKATPVFVDSESSTWNMDPELLRTAIQECMQKNKKPKAIIIVHLYGMPAQLDALFSIAADYDIPVIEDAAESLGSTYKGKHTGTRGKFGVLSFNGNKIITTSGGGALIADDIELVAKARFLATQARDPAPHYQHSVVGYNYRMSNVLAAIGRGQMTVLSDRIRRRREIFVHYQTALASLPGITFLPEPEGLFSNRWLTTILIDPQLSGTDTTGIRLALEAENIESRPLWKPLHLQPVFAPFPKYVSGLSKKCFDQGLCLPSGTALTEKDLTNICSIIQQTVRR